MNWDEIIKDVEKLLSSRNLKSPHLRSVELSNLDVTFRKYFPNIVSNPDILSRRDKEEFKSNLARVLHKNKLNGAEESIINNFYQIIGALSVEKIGTNAEDQGKRVTIQLRTRKPLQKQKRKINLSK